MKVVADLSRCESNTICMGIAPEVFEVGDDDRLRLLVDEVDEPLAEKVREAVWRCPKQALSVVETATQP